MNKRILEYTLKALSEYDNKVPPMFKRKCFGVICTVLIYDV